MKVDQNRKKLAVILCQKEGNMDIKIDDLVTFKKGIYADEEDAVYRVLEINGDRCFLEFVNTSMAIRPQSVAMLSDLSLLAEREL